jgi:hypothetical protein
MLFEGQLTYRWQKVKVSKGTSTKEHIKEQSTIIATQ